MKEYWEQRFRKEGRIWSDNPSKSAVYAADLFKNHPVRDIMIPGFGYGRNARPFLEKGFNVSGIEISEEAIRIYKNSDLNGKINKIHNGSILDLELDDNKYDAVFSFNVLHLFQEKDRMAIINRCRSILNNAGLLFFSVVSEFDPGFGKGTEIEYNTFDKGGKPVHYFTETDLKDHFRGFRIIETRLIDEPEEHGESGKHVHKCRLIIARYEQE